MQHLILGTGNLGQDLDIELRRAGHQTTLVYKKDFNFPKNSVASLSSFGEVDIIWNCIGCGSINEGEENFTSQFMKCTGLTEKLVKQFPGSTVITFSSDYANDPKNLYGLNKQYQDMFVEHAIKRGANVRAIRVTCLYGSHAPENGLPWKLLENNIKEDYAAFNSNHVCPTPTDWLAWMIVKNLDAILENEKIFSIAPKSPLPIRQFARVMLEQVGDRYDIKLGTKGFDKLRPNSPVMDDNLAHDEEDCDCIRLLAERLLFYRDLWSARNQESPRYPTSPGCPKIPSQPPAL